MNAGRIIAIRLRAEQNASYGFTSGYRLSESTPARVSLISRSKASFKSRGACAMEKQSGSQGVLLHQRDACSRTLAGGRQSEDLPRIAASASGFRPDPRQPAAHYLPRFVAIKLCGDKTERYLWDFVPDKVAQAKIASLFRETQDLPTLFNQADSAAEGKR